MSTLLRVRQRALMPLTRYLKSVFIPDSRMEPAAVSEREDSEADQRECLYDVAMAGLYERGQASFNKILPVIIFALFACFVVPRPANE